MSCTYTRYDPASVYPVIDPNTLVTNLPHHYAFAFHQDGIEFTVEDDPSLTRCQIRVVLTTAPSVTWRKELHGWNYFNNSSVLSLATENGDHGPYEMVIRRAECQTGVGTILFKKIAWNRIMYNMYTLDPTQLWTFWGGKKVTVEWRVDDRGSGVWGEDAIVPPSEFPDGKLVTANGRPVFVMYGRAKFSIGLGPLPETMQRLGLTGTPVTVDRSLLDRFRLLPIDYTLLREDNQAPIYVMFGGAKFHIPDFQTFPRIGLNAANTRLIPDGSLWENRIGDIPRDGTVLREETDPRVFLMRNSQKCHISSPTRLEELCLSWNDVRVVPNGGLIHLPTGPTI